MRSKKELGTDHKYLTNHSKWDFSVTEWEATGRFSRAGQFFVHCSKDLRLSYHQSYHTTRNCISGSSLRLGETKQIQSTGTDPSLPTIVRDKSSHLVDIDSVLGSMQVAFHSLLVLILPRALRCRTWKIIRLRLKEGKTPAQDSINPIK